MAPASPFRTRTYISYVTRSSQVHLSYFEMRVEQRFGVRAIFERHFVECLVLLIRDRLRIAKEWIRGQNEVSSSRYFIYAYRSHTGGLSFTRFQGDSVSFACGSVSSASASLSDVVSSTLSL